MCRVADLEASGKGALKEKRKLSLIYMWGKGKWRLKSWTFRDGLGLDGGDVAPGCRLNCM